MTLRSSDGEAEDTWTGDLETTKNDCAVDFNDADNDEVNDDNDGVGKASDKTVAVTVDSSSDRDAATVDLVTRKFDCAADFNDADDDDDDNISSNDDLDVRIDAGNCNEDCVGILDDADDDEDTVNDNNDGVDCDDCESNDVDDDDNISSNGDLDGNGRTVADNCNEDCVGTLECRKTELFPMELSLKDENANAGSENIAFDVISGSLVCLNIPSEMAVDSDFLNVFDTNTYVGFGSIDTRLEVLIELE